MAAGSSKIRPHVVGVDLLATCSGLSAFDIRHEMQFDVPQLLRYNACQVHEQHCDRTTYAAGTSFNTDDLRR